MAAPAKLVDNLTGIRGFAALWVACFHFQNLPIMQALQLGPIVTRGFRGVDVFFVLSGLVLALNYAQRFASPNLDWAMFREFLVRRFARIYPVHLATFLIVFAGFEFAVHTGHNFPLQQNDDLWTAICNLLLVHAWGMTKDVSWNIASWSISAEWFAYIFVFPFCVLILRRLSVIGCLSATFISWLAFLGFVFLFQRGGLAFATTDGALRIIPEFIGGYSVYRIITQASVKISGDLSAAIGLAAILIISYLPAAAVVLLLPAIMMLMIGLYAGGTAVNAVFGHKVAIFLGEISYSIYMVHLIVAVLFDHFAWALNISATLMHAVLIFIIEMLTTISLSYLMYISIELPGRAMIAQRFTRTARLNSAAAAR
jgi:peptidoglycan/LPS O-acetylase OafA/YrhL